MLFGSGSGGTAGGFAILNMDNTENFWYFLSRVVLKPQICFEEEHLKQFHGFPYIVGIDIFILDTMIILN